MTAFNERTITIFIDDTRCTDCRTKACIKACSRYSRGILRLQAGKPTVVVSSGETERQGTECLACEYECRLRGLSAIRIVVPMPELSKYRESLSNVRG